MQIGDWITLAAVIVALGLGVLSLVQTQRLQKKERKERLLNEIIEWAESITVFSAKQIVDDRTNAKIILNDAAERLKDLNVLAAKGIYIGALVSGIFPNNAVLLADIKKFRKRISQHTGVISLVVRVTEVAQVDQGKAMQILDKRLGAETRHGIKLRDDAIELINFVARIYTKAK